VTFKIYVEGGGDRKDLLTKCRKGFTKFFQQAELKGKMPKVVACGGRGNAYNRFCTAIKNRAESYVPLLLVDSEGPVLKEVWAHLKDRDDDNWNKPNEADESHAFLMVQCMENWFLADRQCLVKFYGQGFNEKILPRKLNIEDAERNEVNEALRNATKRTTKGKYSKGAHSFDILERLNPDLVINNSPHAARLFKRLRQ